VAQIIAQSLTESLVMQSDKW